MNPLLRHSAAHLFVESLDLPEIGSGDLHHLQRVLRIRPGDPITVSDGEGRWMPAHLVEGRIEPAGEVVVEAEPPRSTIVTAIPKGERVEWIAQKVSELGVSELVLADFARSVVRWDAARAAKQQIRLQRVMIEAAMQARRVWLPTLTIGERFADAARRADAALAEPDGTDELPGRCLIIGPEGGFSEAELDAGLPRVGLAENVLRVETAAVVGALRVVSRC